ncbi:MAG: CDP-alcohol phosphatidyltransferase family protein [Vicinamibacterales bacterium]
MSARLRPSDVLMLPSPPLRRRAILCFALLTLATLQLGVVLARAIDASEVYPLKVTLLFGLAAVIAIGWIAGHHPFDRFGPANGVTGIRLAMTSLTAGLIGEPPTQTIATAAAWLALLATLLDGVDGWLARRTRLASAFGARFDMETDALLILALAIIAWQHGKAGAWIVLAGAMRYLFVAAGYVWSWMNAPLPPSTRRKAVCVVQLVGLGLVVSPLLAAPASVVAAAITLAALTWSFGVDVLWLRHHEA